MTAAASDEYVSGELTTGVTEAGSRFTVDSRVDRYGRASTHMVTGFTPRGLSAYFARNLNHRTALDTLAAAERAGWTNLTLGLEGF